MDNIKSDSTLYFKIIIRKLGLPGFKSTAKYSPGFKKPKKGGPTYDVWVKLSGERSATLPVTTAIQLKEASITVYELSYFKSIVKIIEPLSIFIGFQKYLYSNI